ncbi:MAG TPA: enoyl-CoA hydratase/isomerase family protein [Verrucomicrobiae bacterium]|nr:enoyl-CoA hydratase/isomerase family protein [Verrucomicrobiae bacterium]
MSGIEIERSGAKATLWLDRPERHNAFDDALIAELSAALVELAADSAIRVVLLAGRGKSFSAGADLAWMKRTAGYTAAENEADALKMAEMLNRLDSFPKPTIALVQGAAMGGGVGLVAACDIAIAAEDAQFAFSEARLGLTPATISPYVIAAIGPRAARRYFLTAERFGAQQALDLGLVSAVVPAADLAEEANKLADILCQNSPGAMAEAKRLIADVTGRPIDAALRSDTAGRIARQRASVEGREGVAAFLEKRKPSWQG